MEQDSGDQDKKVRFDEWMGNESADDHQINENIDRVFAVDKFSKQDKKGHLLLQLQKTYKDDDRFKLNKDFEADDIKKLPSNMLGSLSTREHEMLLTKKKKKTQEEENSANTINASIMIQ